MKWILDNYPSVRKQSSLHGGSNSIEDSEFPGTVVQFLFFFLLYSPSCEFNQEYDFTYPTKKKWLPYAIDGINSTWFMVRDCILCQYP
jgi:hypothetical protein